MPYERKSKTCTGCGKRKRLEEFTPKRDTKDRRVPQCKECRAAYQRARYHSFPPTNARPVREAA